MPSYDLKDREHALTVVALCAGSTTQAAKRLKESGHPIPRTTLASWKHDSEADRYREICAEVEPKVRQAVAAQQVELVAEATALELNLVADIAQAREQGSIPTKELASTLRNVAVPKGIALTHVLRPEMRVHHVHKVQGVDEILRKLDQYWPDTQRFDAEGEAEELPAPRRLSSS